MMKERCAFIETAINGARTAMGKSVTLLGYFTGACWIIFMGELLMKATEN